MAALSHAREQALRVAALESHRAALRDGEPCPLCGANDHPYARSLPTEEVNDDTLGEARDALAAVQQTLARMSSSEAHLQERLARLTTACEDAAARRQASDEALTSALADLGLTALAPADGARQLSDLAKAAAAEAEALAARMVAVEAGALRVTEARERAQTTETARVAAQHRHQLAETARAAAAQTVRERSDTRAQCDQALQLQQDALSRQLAGFGEGLPSLHGADMADVLARLDARAARWQQDGQALQQLGETLASLRTRADELAGQCAAATEAHAQRLALRGERAQRLNGLNAQRAELLGGEAVSTVVARHDAARAEAQAALDAATGQDSAAQQARVAAQTALQARMTRIDARAIERADLTAQLAGLAEAAGFADAAAGRAALLEHAELTRLRECRDGLTRREAALASAQAANAQALEQARAQTPGDAIAADAATLEARLPALVAQRDAASQQLGALRQQQADDDRRGRTHADQYRIHQALDAERTRWALLSRLIGSHDGKRFRVFAQGLTFDAVIALANRHLARMSDRYALVRDGNTDLGLAVIDAWQEGECRPTSNLSGGERFLLSLALALGLSNMAGSKIRLDSLFLDEGFGTLDDQALEVALGALASLRQDGKLVGVISHVGELKSRIATQIVVTPGATGVSRLSGPGCTRDG